MDTLEEAIAGLQKLETIPQATREAAISALRQWWEGEPTAAYRPAIATLVASGRYDELLDAFRQVLPFGTGGRRGLVGVGPNRINPWTVASSIQGHADWLARRFAGRSLRVVIAYDVRRFVDTNKRYGDAPGPIKDLSSRQLAEQAAAVYTASGIVAYMLPKDASRYLSTPELSFCIRALGADGGVNISASHNPPDDNGVKVYDATGAQLAPPEDQSLLDEVSRVETVRSSTYEAAIRSGLVRWVTSELHEGYLRASASAAPKGGRSAPINLYYTPLHGTGVVHEVLAAAGFPCELHAPQATPDGAFPTVPGAVANPEAPAAMAHALAAAPPEVDLVFGTDPDADRIGCEVRHQGRWVHLTGNDIAVLAVHAVTRAPQPDGRRPLVIVTEVTSSLVGRVARAAGATVIDDLLVGFKYVAEGLRVLEQRGAWRGIAADEVRFVAGAEESHGVLMTDQIRDKDAAGGAVVLAALAALLKADGATLVDRLEQLRSLHGEICNDQVSLQYGGAEGQQRLADLLDGLRASPPQHIGARAVRTAIDHRDEGGRFGPFLSASDRAARNVLVYTLAAGERDDGARIILRPSGTEPKLKVYVELLGRPHLDDQAIAAVRGECTAMCQSIRAWLA